MAGLGYAAAADPFVNRTKRVPLGHGRIVAMAPVRGGREPAQSRHRAARGEHRIRSATDLLTHIDRPIAQGRSNPAIQKLSPPGGIEEHRCPSAVISAPLDDRRVSPAEPLFWIAAVRSRASAPVDMMLSAPKESGHEGIQDPTAGLVEHATMIAWMLDTRGLERSAV